METNIALSFRSVWLENRHYDVKPAQQSSQDTEREGEKTVRRQK